LRDLATHLSGFPAMPTNFDLHAIPDPISAYSLDNLEAFLATFDPQREPGVAFEYSNLGVALLGRLLGRRAGKEYEELLRERVLIPLGLESTFITPSAEQSARVTPGHDRYLRPVDTWEMRAMPASGSLRSSANDVLTFLSVYFNGLDTPLRQAADFQLAQPRPAVGPSQGLGLMVRRTGPQTTYGFNGSKEGYVAFIGFDPAAAVGVVVLSNNRPDDTLDALGLHILTGRPLAVVDPVPPPRELSQPPSVPRRVLDRYEGTYIEGKTRYVVACTARRLLLQTWGDGVDEFFLERDQRFISRTSEDTLQFDASNGGPAPSFTIRTGGAERRAVRMPRSG